MIINPTIETILNHKSIRKYKDESISDEQIISIVRAGQQAPFATQSYSLLLSRKKDKNPFHAPLLFTICVDLHKLELVLRARKWHLATNDLALLLFVTQDASLAAQNMALAAESMGLGTCFLGGTFYAPERIINEYKLPNRVFPILQLVMGYPDENPDPRPRFPIEYVLYEDQYPNLDELTSQAIIEMDKGYAAQDYYRVRNIHMIPLENREEIFTSETYVWSEHISRKWGQWHRSLGDILEPLKKCGFCIAETQSEDETDT